MRRIENHNGFTLVELAVALGIIAILMLGAGVSIVNSLPQARLRRAVRDLVSVMQDTKIRTIKENMQYQIVFDTVNNIYTVWSAGGDGNFATPADNTTVNTVRLEDYGSGVRFGPGNAVQNWNGDPIVQRPTLTYTVRGLCDVGSIYLTNQDNVFSYGISTTIAGGKRVRYYDGNNNWTDE